MRGYIDRQWCEMIRQLEAEKRARRDLAAEVAGDEAAWQSEYERKTNVANKVRGGHPSRNHHSRNHHPLVTTTLASPLPSRNHHPRVTTLV